MVKYKFGPATFDFSQRPYIMGILNVTPDSFSDGGLYANPESAIQRGLQMLTEGADIIDIGGESTRPGSERVSTDEELRRVMPVIEGLLERKPDAIISIDTYKSVVAKWALRSGAVIVNDISALRFDGKMIEIVQEYGASVILMHMKGEPRTMQEAPYYDNVVTEVKSFLEERINFVSRHGVEQIVVDPGIGFGKRVQDNLEILRSISEFTELGYPLLVGASRKSFLGTILNLPVGERLSGSLAAAAIAVFNGAAIIRTHDIAATKDAVQTAYAIKQGATYQELSSGYTEWKSYASDS